MSEMKALSLKQPWAELVVSGKKTIELRKWKTNFRGEFLVHASKIPDFDAMKRLGFENNALPLGMLVGKAEVVGIKDYSKEGKEEFEKDKDKHLATSEWGEAGFLLKNAIRLEKPITALGKLNFWEFDGKI